MYFYKILGIIKLNKTIEDYRSIISCNYSHQNYCIKTDTNALLYNTKSNNNLTFNISEVNESVNDASDNVTYDKNNLNTTSIDYFNEEKINKYGGFYLVWERHGRVGQVGKFHFFLFTSLKQAKYHFYKRSPTYIDLKRSYNKQRKIMMLKCRVSFEEKRNEILKRFIEENEKNNLQERIDFKNNLNLKQSKVEENNQILTNALKNLCLEKKEFLSNFNIICLKYNIEIPEVKENIHAYFGPLNEIYTNEKNFDIKILQLEEEMFPEFKKLVPKLQNYSSTHFSMVIFLYKIIFTVHFYNNNLIF